MEIVDYATKKYMAFERVRKVRNFNFNQGSADYESSLNKAPQQVKAHSHSKSLSFKENGK